MHDIDLMLDHSLRGEFKESRAISDKLEALGPKETLRSHINILITKGFQWHTLT